MFQRWNKKTKRKETDPKALSLFEVITFRVCSRDSSVSRSRRAPQLIQWSRGPDGPGAEGRLVSRLPYDACFQWMLLPKPPVPQPHPRPAGLSLQDKPRYCISRAVLFWSLSFLWYLLALKRFTDVERVATEGNGNKSWIVLHIFFLVGSASYWGKRSFALCRIFLWTLWRKSGFMFLLSSAPDEGGFHFTSLQNNFRLNEASWSISSSQSFRPRPLTKQTRPCVASTGMGTLPRTTSHCGTLPYQRSSYGLSSAVYLDPVRVSAEPVYAHRHSGLVDRVVTRTPSMESIHKDPRYPCWCLQTC